MIVPILMGIVKSACNLLSSFGLRRWQHTIVRDSHERYKTTEITGCRKPIVIPRSQIYPSFPTLHIKLCRRLFPTKISFTVTVN